MSPEIEKLLAEVEKFAHPRREKTLFSLGGRGYFENPASDILAFFLAPDADHGFRDLFLDAFLECMGLEPANFVLREVTIQREPQTNEGNRIDLVVRGSNWILLIENKIYHSQNNPFDSYEVFGKTHANGGQLLLAILSPEGRSNREKWKPVSYKSYCSVLRRRFGTVLFEQTYSKWMVFVREFILHLESELYEPAMNDQQADFVENHAAQIKQVKDLDKEYRSFLLKLLKERLMAASPGLSVNTGDDGWAVRCYADTWGRSNLAFYQDLSKSSPKFFNIVYLVDITPDQMELARKEFGALSFNQEGRWLTWRSQPGYDSRADAVDGLCKLGVVLAEIFKPLPNPALPKT